MTPLEFAAEVRNRCQTIMVAGHQGRPERCGELAAELATLAGQMVKQLKEAGDAGPGRYDLSKLMIEADPEPGE